MAPSYAGWATLFYIRYVQYVVCNKKIRFLLSDINKITFFFLEDIENFVF